MVDKRKRY